MPQYPTKNLLRKCPLCSNKVGEVLHTQNFLLAESNFLPNSYDVVCCSVCGFVFADTSASQSEYDCYYENLSKYENIATSSGSGNTFYDKNRLEQTARDISYFFPEKGSNILDVGCANGGLLIEMKKLGYVNLSGLDPSPICVETVNKIGIQGVSGGLYTVNNFSKKFDGILLTHVLEHVFDVQGAIKNLLSWLHEGGKLYIEVPDASRYQNFSITPYYFFDVEHINHFDEDSLANMFSNYDGKILKIEQKDMMVSDTQMYPAIYIVFQKFSEKIKTNTIFHSASKAKKSIINHIKESGLSISDPMLEFIVANQQPIVVWGAGQATQRLLQNTILRNANILFFVDNDEKKHDLVIKGKKVFPPKKIVETEAIIGICSALHSEEILEQIKNMGINNKTLIIT